MKGHVVSKNTEVSPVALQRGIFPFKLKSLGSQNFQATFILIFLGLPFLKKTHQM